MALYTKSSGIMPPSELVRKAAAFIAEERKLHPEKRLSALLDEAGMRFNLNPLDAASLERVFAAPPAETPGQENAVSQP